MRPGDQGEGQDRKGSSTKPKHPHERWQVQQTTGQAPRSWTNKTMHHPATRIGEIRHGK
jgi:hypothetical protein